MYYIYIQKNKIIKTDYVRNINKKKTELKKHNSREYPGKYMLKTNISAGINRELNYKHISFCLQIHSLKDFLLYIKKQKKIHQPQYIWLSTVSQVESMSDLSDQPY